MATLKLRTPLGAPLALAAVARLHYSRRLWRRDYFGLVVIDGRVQGVHVTPGPDAVARAHLPYTRELARCLDGETTTPGVPRGR